MYMLHIEQIRVIAFHHLRYVGTSYFYSVFLFGVLGGFYEIRYEILLKYVVRTTLIYHPLIHFLMNYTDRSIYTEPQYGYLYPTTLVFPEYI